MKWIQYTLKTTTAAVDLISNLLYELGVQGIEIEDNVPLTENEKKQMFVDIPPDTSHDDGTATIRFYMEPEHDVALFSSQVKEGLSNLSAFINIGEASINLSETEDKDWLNNWKTFFKPFRLSERILVKPTWENLDSIPDHTKSDLVIEIDPGIAFGTGSHETTQLCILALEKRLKPGMKLLDVGCGSGILSIAGILLGADYALGIDVDPNALHSARDNRDANHIPSAKFQLLSGNLIEDPTLQEQVGFQRYDVIVANILADVIISLSGVVARHLVPNGLFISSGILDTKKEDVQNALEKNGFSILETCQMGDWMSFVCRI